MPELPEVQTTVNGLQPLIHKEITKIKLYSTKLRYKIPKNITKVAKNLIILKIYRLGKYIIFNCSNNYSLVFHLGMSGRLKISNINDYDYKKHDHILLFINGFNILLFNDPRKFGFVDIVKTHLINNKKYIAKLGIDALDCNFTFNYLFVKIKNSKVTIKQILLNQGIISGIGNIYASEILFDAKISPFTRGSELSITQIRRLTQSIQKILYKAINFGGTSIRNYASTDGTLGKFQNKFKVYNKENKKILGFRIRRVIQSGRSTFYCPGIQKINKNKIN